MRNLKRALSLTLASVMLLGMMVVGSSAAAGYDDVSETDNVEAIEVLQTIEVMVGDERGFGPERSVNRAEMAVVMGKLLNLDYNYYSATCPFDDVYDWARGWVGACAANGIVSGRGDGVYDPGATVTAVEAASMLMRALGYFKYQSDYANGFEVSTVLQGNNIGIFDGVGSSATEPMTRNQVAQMVLNALQSGMVQADGNTLNYFDNNGNVIATSGKVNYVYVTSNKPFAKAISGVAASSMGSVNDDPIVELGEQLYNGDLKLYGEGGNIADRVWDVFGRPARRWEYKGQEIGTYVKNELLKESYTAKVTGQTLYDLLGKSTIDTYNFRITIDGVKAVDDIYGADANAATILTTAMFSQNDMYRTNKDAVGRTGNGVLTQVYVDTDFTKSNNNTNDYWVYISIINTYLAKATEDYDTKNDDVNLRVWRLDKISDKYVKSTVKNDTATDKTSDYEDIDAAGEDFALVKDVKKDDLYKVTVADGEIQTIEAPEILSAVTVDAFKLFDHVTTGGQQYDHATTARYDVEAIENWTSINDALNLKELTYNVILDDYGYLIGLERNEDPDQYVFLTGIEAGASNLYAKQVDANVIHMDGTMETIKVDMTKSTWGNPGSADQSFGSNLTTNMSQMNTWCAYTVSNSGVYTLRRVPVATTTNLTGGNIKAGQFAQDVAIHNDGPTDYDKSINTKRVSLIAAYNDVTSTRQYVYGNDDTVYLTVSLEKVAVDDKTDKTTYDKTTGTRVPENVAEKRWIVDDVDSVVTGVKNANLVAEDKGMIKDGFGYPESEIYTLYNKDGIVIAAVVIGEDDGASSSYAYIHSGDLEEESYAHSSATKSGDGEWTWTRKAIVNGQIVTLKEVGDNPQYLHPLDSLHPKGMQQGLWYEVRYDANGNVRRADVVVNGSEVKYPNLVSNVESAVNSNSDTVVLKDITTIDGLSYKNGTLYTNVSATRGFSVDPDVKTVLILAGKENSGSYGPSNVEIFDSVADGYTGYAGLERALREMNDDDGGYVAYEDVASELNEVEIAAVLESGRATTIIINDKTPAPDNRPDTGKPIDPVGKNVIYNINDYRNVTFYKGSTLVTADDISAYGVGTQKFTVAKDVVVSLYAAAGTFGSKAAAVKVGGITFTVNANGDTASFTMPNDNVTLPSPADIRAEVNKEDDNNPGGGTDAIDAALKGKVKVVKATDSTVLSTYTVTDAHVITATDDVAAGSKYAGLAVGDLYLGFTVPSGKAITAADNVTIVTAAGEYAVTAKANFGTSGAVKGAVAKANVPAGEITEIRIPVTEDATATTYPVTVNVPEGYTPMLGGSNTPATVAGNNSTALKLVFKASDAATLSGVSEVTLDWSVTGLGATEIKTTNVTGTVSNGVVTVSALAGTNMAATDNVVVTVSNVKGSKVAGKLDLADDVKTYITNAAGTDAGITATAGLTKDAEVDLQATKAKEFALAGNIKSVVVTYELTGVTAKSGNEAAVTGTGTIDATSKELTLYKTGTTDTAAAGKATFTVDGDEAVVLKITGVTEIVFDKAKFSTIAVPIGGQAITTTAAGANITLVQKAGKWVNKDAVTLSFTPASAFTAGKTAKMTFDSGATYTGVETKLTTTATAANTDAITISLDAETLEFTDFVNAISILPRDVTP
ncbi:S-layer homology domain-containing protein [Flintibacter muris]|uniref:S-layer homology domain-containing protein n=1 Tax=Flintibacter muris TaxID=2941327 RepID=UPI00203E6D7C|nr:S-layer homology domain-containing protein [Flintibacter muris]